MNGVNGVRTSGARVRCVGRGYRAQHCAGCGLRTELCLCATLDPIETRLRITLVVHWRERSKPTNTSRLAHALLSNSVIVERGRSEDSAGLVASALRALDPARCLVLYPSEDATPLDELSAPETYEHLVVPDGTWGQTRRWLRREPRLREMRKVRIPAHVPLPEYRLRRSPGPAFASTFAATAHALGALESPDVEAQMLSIFGEWQDRAMSSRRGGLAPSTFAPG